MNRFIILISLIKTNKKSSLVLGDDFYFYQAGILKPNFRCRKSFCL